MIEFRDVDKGFGDPPLWALQGIGLTVEDGEFVTVVGPSGCGKTTLLNLIAGFEFPSAGQVLVNGVPIERPGPDRVVVFQQPTLLPWLTVTDNLGFGLKARGGRRFDSAPVARMVEAMGLQGFERHYPHQLSGGMQQRVAIGRALLLRPAILLMDEPFGALDAETRQEMQRFLLNLWRTDHPTVLFVTHDVDEALLLGDRLVVLSARPGTIVRRISVPFNRPRKWDLVMSREFIELKKQVLKLLRGAPGDSWIGEATQGGDNGR